MNQNSSVESGKNYFVDQNLCIGCTLCTQIAPNTFKMNDEGRSFIADANGDNTEKLAQAMESCPVKCIKEAK